MFTRDLYPHPHPRPLPASRDPRHLDILIRSRFFKCSALTIDPSTVSLLKFCTWTSQGKSIDTTGKSNFAEIELIRLKEEETLIAIARKSTLSLNEYLLHQ